MQTDNRLIYLLSRAHHRLGNHLKKSLASKDIKITPVQAGIMFLLRKHPQTMTELSQSLAIDNSAITGLIDRLEASGFARRDSNPNDRRTYNISLTPAGLEQTSKAEIIVKSVNKEIEAGFSEEEVETFKRILNSFFDKFDKN